ncbi:30S ribosomal protein S20 [Fusibacter sp. JL216-2]|uniref:30S ribosomal protein S20 n=1 Tax=Fusibacter sp. JL216-2 TaxID=3071453 RepID=UPI003D335272
MANIQSAKKRIKVISKKTELNKSRKSALKTAEKRFLEAIEAGDKAVATEKFNTVQKLARKAAEKNVIHKNAASRKVARLSKKLNTLA